MPANTEGPKQITPLLAYRYYLPAFAISTFVFGHSCLHSKASGNWKKYTISS